MLKRILLMLVASLVAVLLVEGLLSLLTGRSLRPRPFVDFAKQMDELLVNRAGTMSEADYWSVHRDPRVGFILRPSVEHEILESRFASDSLGLRERSGPGPEADALKIIILGDSVAFGFGLNDEQTIASQLESVLNRMLGPGHVACTTVAAPGWNHRNAVHFLLDHWQELDPDIVIYMPIANDLNDTYMVDGHGRRRPWLDGGSAEPLLPVFQESLDMYQYLFAQRVAAGEVSLSVGRDELGARALTSDLSAESRRRYDDNVRSILLLHERLSRLGRKLALFHYSEDAGDTGYAWNLRARLLESQRALREIPGFARLEKSFTLGYDPHPNPETARTLAIWAAEELLAAGWIDGAPAAGMPAVPEEHSSLRAAKRSPDEVAGKVRSYRRRSLDRLQDVIDLESGAGFSQVYGGLNPDGSMGTRLSVLLKASGSALKVRLEAIPDQPVLYPVDLRIEIDGSFVGTLTLEGEAGSPPGEGLFPLPESVAAGQPVEVRLTPSNWTLVRYRGLPLLSSCRAVSLSSR